MTQMPENCNILSEDITVQSTCTVKSVSNVTVQWYYTPNEADAGINGTLLPFTNYGRVLVSSVCHPGEVNQCSGELTIKDVNEEDVGYYWCTVDARATGFVSHISTVLYLSGCSMLSDCEKSSNYLTNRRRNFGCAVEQTSEENRNITIVNFYDNCTSDPSPSTPKIEEEPPKFTKTETLSLSSTMVTVAAPSDSTSRTNTTASANTGTRSTEGSGESNMELPLAIVWPIVGGGIGLMLFVVAILLALILIVQCRRKRGKGEETSPHLVHANICSTYSDNKMATTINTGGGTGGRGGGGGRKNRRLFYPPPPELVYTQNYLAVLYTTAHLETERTIRYFGH